MAVKIQLVRSEEHIDPNKEDWELMRRFARLFDYAVKEEDSFSGACEEAFESALEACADKQWDILSQEDVNDDLARLAVYFKESLINYAISQEEPWADEMIEHRIAIHSLDFQGNTALHAAAREGASHLISSLAGHIKIDEKNAKNQTPLEVAIQFGKDPVVLELIKKGVNIHEWIHLGEDRSIRLDSIAFAVMRGEIKCIETLITQGKCSLGGEYERMGNLLHVAIHFHQFEALKYLLETHQDKVKDLINKENSDRLTPLSFAASLGEQKPISLLHQVGASLEAQDNQKRRPLHHAALSLHYDTIQLLAALGAKIMPEDQNHDRPLDLIDLRKGSAATSCKNLLKSLKSNQALKKHFPAPQFQSPKNLVFRGGGPKGIAFMGALQILDKQRHLSKVKRVAGTSAGAITAALVAIDYPMDGLQNLLMATNLMDFLDSPLRLENLKDASHSIPQVIHTLQTCYKAYKNPLGFITNQLKRLYRCTGICEGEVFRKWMEERIQYQTGKQYLTFGELAELVEKKPGFKHLHVYGTRIGKTPKIVHISSQNPECKNMIISDAIRISMSIPGVFKPHIMHILQKNHGKRDRISYPQFGSFLDGGMLYNFPVETFDQKQYLTQEDLGSEGKHPKYNKETIGLTLFSSLTPKTPPTNVKNVLELLMGISQVYLGAEDAIRSLNSYNQSRVIEIDVKKVGTLSFNMTDDTKEELIRSGQQAMEGFINKKTGPSPYPVKQKEKTLQEKIKERKHVLTSKRKKDLNKYPPYFDHLLEKGFLHLYDHLLEMKTLPTRNKREEKIQTLTFSKISHIILETKKAIIDQVTSQVPSDTKHVLFLLGGTGAGKTTTLCFLQGDQMVLNRNGDYASTSRDALIGHDGASSCTFLPTVETLQEKDLVIIDFPGFSDTNGSLTSLGIECGLKHLTQKYQPEILVLEAITNTEKKYAAAAQLGQELKRLLGDTQRCVLGMTKYSKDVNFREIKAAEKKQKEQFNRPSKKEEKLETQIQTLSDLNMPDLQSRVEGLQKELKELKEQRIKESREKLPETEEKKAQHKELEKKEGELLKQMGLKKKITLSDLENPQIRTECLNTLFQSRGGIPWSAQQTLDTGHEKLLNERFENDLMPKIDELKSFDIKDFDVFEQSVLETSLIKVLLASSHREIGEFLHLPEIDPKIVDHYSKQIVGGCIEKLIDSVIQNIDTTLINKFLKDFGGKASSRKKEGLQEKQKNVQDYIFGLKGIEADTLEQSDQKWEKLRREKQTQIQEVEKDVEKRNELSLLQLIAYTIPLGIPLWFHLNRKESEKKEKVQATVDEIFDEYSQSLDAVYSALVKLKGLEKMIEKKEALNRIAQSFSPSFESLRSLIQSIDRGIHEVKEIYEEKHWDARVTFLRQKIGSFFSRDMEEFDLDLALMLYVGLDPSVEIISLQGDVEKARRLLRLSFIAHENALVLRSDGAIKVLKKYRESEERFDRFIQKLQFKDPLHIEITDKSIKTKIILGNKYSIKKSVIARKLTDMEKVLGMELNSPLSQMLLRDAIKSKVVLEKESLLGEKIVEEPRELLQFPFGKSAWSKYFGDIGEEPPLPQNIKQILNSPCIFWPDKKVRETHILVLIPEKVNGKPFHLNHLSELIKRPKSGHKTKYEYYDEEVRKELGAKSLGSHWVLMTKEVIPESQGKSYDDQKKLVQSHAQKSGIAYELPKALEAAAAILMHYFETGERLYGTEPTFTRCQEKVDNNPRRVAIGCFSDGGLFVNYVHWIDFSNGLGCCQKF